MKTHKITKDNATEQDPGMFYTEASDIELPPGIWPDTLETSLGNGQPLRRLPINQEDIKFVVYQQPETEIQVTVFND